MRLVGALPTDKETCARGRVSQFLKERDELMDVTWRVDAYGKLRTAMAPWRGIPGWAGWTGGGKSPDERWTEMLKTAGAGEAVGGTELEWLGEARFLGLSSLKASANPMEADVERERVDEERQKMRDVLELWIQDCP